MLKIKGFQKTSLIDYPDKICSIVFLSVCNFRCPYCQNPDLVEDTYKLPDIPEEDILKYLDEKKKWIDAVVVSGGEPLLHKEVYDFIKKIKERGFLVKVDTNGTNPLFLKTLIDDSLIDYVALDIKAPLEKYDEVAGVKVNKKNILETIDLLKKNNIEHEFRITVVPGLIEKDDFLKMGEWLKGSKRFYIQQFRNTTTLDKNFKNINPFSKKELEEFKEILKPYFEVVGIRGA